LFDRLIACGGRRIAFRPLLPIQGEALL
jgi:hypothetical protein